MIVNLMIVAGAVLAAILAFDLARQSGPRARRDGGPVRRMVMRPVRGAAARAAAVLAVAALTVAPAVIATRDRDAALGHLVRAGRGLGPMEWAVLAGTLLVVAGALALRIAGARDGRPEPSVPAVAATSRDLVRAGIVGVLLGIVGVTTVVVASLTASNVLLAYWCVGAGIVAACLMAFVVGRRFTHLPVAPGRVLCIVPVYNEPAENLDRTVRALLAQTVPVDIVVIDDGSRTPVTPTVAHERLRWMRHENTGKRGAQVAVLRSVPREAYDFVLTVDSDSRPYPDACEHLLRAMSDPRVQAATGMLYIGNHRAGFMTLASDIDIGSSCVMMRASRSMLGALETTSGALAIYRSGLLYDHLEDYAVECGTGDDRWLALRALRRGEVVAVAEARVETDMPESFHGTYRQRLRWARSWWWMLPYVFRNLRFRQVLSPLFGLTQLVVSPVMFAFALATLAGAHVPIAGGAADRVLVLYVVAYLALRYGLAALYLSGRRGMGRGEKLVMLAAGTPLAILANVALLTPTRYIALFHLFDNRWQTRQADPNTAPVPALGRVTA